MVVRRQPGACQPVDQVAAGERLEQADQYGTAAQALDPVVLGAADLAAEALVQLGRGGGDEVEVGEDAAGGEEAADFGEERALAIVLEVVDREAGDDGVEGAVDRERIALMGFSRGAQSALYASMKRFQQAWAPEAAFATYM